MVLQFALVDQLLNNGFYSTWEFKFDFRLVFVFSIIFYYFTKKTNYITCPFSLETLFLAHPLQKPFFLPTLFRKPLLSSFHLFISSLCHGIVILSTVYTSYLLVIIFHALFTIYFHVPILFTFLFL